MGVLRQRPEKQEHSYIELQVKWGWRLEKECLHICQTTSYRTQLTMCLLREVMLFSLQQDRVWGLLEIRQVLFCFVFTFMAYLSRALDPIQKWSQTNNWLQVPWPRLVVMTGSFEVLDSSCVWCLHISPKVPHTVIMGQQEVSHMGTITKRKSVLVSLMERNYIGHYHVWPRSLYLSLCILIFWDQDPHLQTKIFKKNFLSGYEWV